jgi:hypothetical protein
VAANAPLARGAARMHRGIRKGEFVLEEPGEWAFEGLIQHRLCKEGLRTPPGCEHQGQRPAQPLTTTLA